MSTPALGRLEKVDLRTAWMSESGDFTPWLAQAENLKLLGETIDLDLELEAQERAVGPFSADILCRDTASDDHWVLIENQLERTDHKHLGQLLTYAAGLKAATIVWIAERFTEEHRAALDWLNDITGERFAFFGLELELWRISGNETMAPKFNIISKPNEWTRAVRTSATNEGEVSEHKQTQLQFWTAYKDYMEASKSHIRCHKPSPQHWMNHSIGRSGFHLSSALSSWNSVTDAKEPEIRVDLVMSDNNSKKYFALLDAQKDEIERSFGQPLVWYNPPNKKMSRIFIRRSSDFLNSGKWTEQHEWLRLNLEKMHQVFAPIVKQLNATNFVAPEEETSIETI